MYHVICLQFPIYIYIYIYINTHVCVPSNYKYGRLGKATSLGKGKTLNSKPENFIRETMVFWHPILLLTTTLYIYIKWYK